MQIMNRSCLRWFCVDGCQQLAAESLSTACKCHGVSGSCSMRTCWKSLPDLRSVTVKLLDRYSFAVEVAYRRLRRRKSTTSIDTAAIQTTPPANAVTTSQPEKRLVPVLRRRRTLNDTDIVYYTMSPDYCLPDPSLGSVGTKDRYSWRFVTFYISALEILLLTYLLTYLLTCFLTPR